MFHAAPLSQDRVKAMKQTQNYQRKKKKGKTKNRSKQVIYMRANSHLWLKDLTRGGSEASKERVLPTCPFHVLSFPREIDSKSKQRVSTQPQQAVLHATSLECAPSCMTA